MAPRKQVTNDVLAEQLNSLRSDMLLRFDIVDRQINDLNRAVSKLDSDMTRDYVTRAEFLWVQRIVYGGCGVILLSFLGVLITLVGWKQV